MGWERIDDATWEDTVAYLEECGCTTRWTRTMACQDLRYWTAPGRVHPLTGKRPSLRQLAERWGWSKSGVDKLIKSGDWQDSYKDRRW